MTTTTASPHECPKCGGTGDLLTMHGTIPCTLCDETGRVSSSTISRWREGRAFRDARVSRNITLRELAYCCGFSELEIANMERGLAIIPSGLWRHVGGRP